MGTTTTNMGRSEVLAQGRSRTLTVAVARSLPLLLLVLLQLTLAPALVHGELLLTRRATASTASDAVVELPPADAFEKLAMSDDGAVYTLPSGGDGGGENGVPLTWSQLRDEPEMRQQERDELDELEQLQQQQNVDRAMLELQHQYQHQPHHHQPQANKYDYAPHSQSHGRGGSAIYAPPSHPSATTAATVVAAAAAAAATATTDSSSGHCSIEVTSKIRGICQPMGLIGSACVSGDYIDVFNLDCM